VAEADEDYDPDNEEPEEVTFNCFALENAVRQNMSIWRSHGMTGERRKYSSSDDEDDVDDDDDDTDNSQVDIRVAPAQTEHDDDDDWCCAESEPSVAGIYT